MPQNLANGELINRSSPCLAKTQMSLNWDQVVLVYKVVVIVERVSTPKIMIALKT